MAGVEHLALADQIIQSRHYLFYRRYLVPDVNPTEIDVVSEQPRKTRFYGLDHALTVISRCIRAVPGAAFGYFVPGTGLWRVRNEFSEERLTRTVGVNVVGIDEVGAGYRLCLNECRC